MRREREKEPSPMPDIDTSIDAKIKTGAHTNVDAITHTGASALYYCCYFSI